MKIEDTIAERAAIYGEYADQARIAMQLQNVLRGAKHPPAPISENGASCTTPRTLFDKLRPYQQHALTMIFEKIARIATGDPNYRDNWHDIGGYARLAEDRLPAPTGKFGQEEAGPQLELPIDDRIEALTKQRDNAGNHAMDWETTAVELDIELADAKREIERLKDLGHQQQQALEKEVAYLRAANEAWQKRFADLAALTPPKPTYIRPGKDGMIDFDRPIFDKVSAGIDLAKGPDQTAIARYNNGIARVEDVVRVSSGELTKGQAYEAINRQLAHQEAKAAAAQIMAATRANHAEQEASISRIVRAEDATLEMNTGKAVMFDESSEVGVDRGYWQKGYDDAHNGRGRDLLDTFDQQKAYDAGYDTWQSTRRIASVD